MGQVIQRFNICVGKGYLNTQNEQKTEWITIGNAAQMDDGKIYLNINCTPTFTWDGRATLFVREQSAQKPIQQSTYNQTTQGAYQPTVQQTLQQTQYPSSFEAQQTEGPF